MHCSAPETDVDYLCGSEFQQCQFLLKKIDELLYAPCGQRGAGDVFQHCKHELEMEPFYFSVKTMLVVVSLLARVLLR